MLKFISEYKLLILLSVMVVALSKMPVSMPVVVFVSTLIFVLFLLKGFYKEVLLFFYLMLVFSDNYHLGFASTVKPILLIILTIFSVRNGTVLSKNMIFKSFALFFVYGIALLFLSPDFSLSLQKFTSYVLLFLTIPGYVMFLVDKYGVEVILDMVKLSTLLLLISLLLLVVNPAEVQSHGGRFKGVLGNPNGLAMFCFFNFILFQLYKDYLGGKALDKLSNILITGVILFALLLSGSRTSILAIVIFLFFRQFSQIPTLASFFLLGIIIWSYEYIFTGGVALITELGLTEEFRLEKAGQSVELASGRVIAWRYTWIEIQKNLFFGRGWSYDELWIFGSIQKTLNDLNHQGGVHNSYLIFWINTGIVGLLLYMTSLIRLFLKAGKNSKLALPILFGALFVANLEPWLTASLNPYTIQFLICLSLMLYIPKKDKNEEMVNA